MILRILKADSRKCLTILMLCSVIAAILISSGPKMLPDGLPCSRNGPNMVPNRPQCFQNGPKIGPSCPQIGPSCPQMLPKCSQNGVKISPQSVPGLEPHFRIDLGRVWHSILVPQGTSEININRVFHRIDCKPKFKAFFSYFLL